MKKNRLTKQILLALAMGPALTTGILLLGISTVEAIDVVGTGYVGIQEQDSYTNVYGNYLAAEHASLTGTIEMTGGEVTGDWMMGGYLYGSGTVSDSEVIISEGTVVAEVMGGYLYGSGVASNNKVNISGGTINGEVYGAVTTESEVELSSNVVNISGGTINKNVTGGGMSIGSSVDNRVIISGMAQLNGDSVFGGSGDTAVSNSVEVKGGIVSSALLGGDSTENASENHVVVSGGTVKGAITGGRSGKVAENNIVTISGGVIMASEEKIFGGDGIEGASGNQICINGEADISAKNIAAGNSTAGLIEKNEISVTGGTINASYITGGDGHEVRENRVTITGGTVHSRVFGGYGDKTASGNSVYLLGGTVTNNIYGGGIDPAFSGGTANNNRIYLYKQANVSDAGLYGSTMSTDKTEGNVLILDSWSGSTKTVQNFNDIIFQGIQWQNGGIVLAITESGQEKALEGTCVKVNQLSMAGGTVLHVGDSMTLIQSNADTGLSLDNVNVTESSEFSAGVATVGTGIVELQGTNNDLIYKITNVERNPQTDVVAGNRLAGAAFVSQGADIAADSLHLLDDGYHWGTQVFGAVYGNRSTYDAAGDVKINGWSEIVGVGNIHRVDGGRLAWGIFYENGTGNYRTWNEFNNEMFRGDGSLVYNGGGAAVRLTKDSGVYYEASLRTGNLSSSMSDAVRDGDGNSYGFDSDSTYWGAHVGAGRLLETERGQWDLYGKYFHTAIDGDSFEMGGDRFSFDRVTSDRLRIGARYTPETDSAWKVYYGAAYEYEFSGDSRMKAGQWETEQSLGGSTVFGEVGTVWGRKDSNWSVDVNLRGYAGEREGFSGMVQLAYAF